VTNASGPLHTSRRAALKTLAWGALVAVAGGTIARVRTQGYLVTRKKPLLSLEPWELVVVEHAARRIAAPDRPGDRSIPSPDDVDVAGFVDAYVAKMAAPMRRDLSRAFLYLEQVAPLALGLAPRFTLLPPVDQDRVLASLEASPVMLLRGAFAGIKSLVFMGYYRDARTWPILGYGGPWIGTKQGPFTP
jgi:hypothetical protein